MPPAPNHRAYVLITPAKNEEAAIGKTIASVISQTIRPAEWVIVSDGSTDRTDEIVRAAVATHPWIRLLPLPPRVDRNFAAVVHATEAGISALTVQAYDYLGLLDSDVSFQSDYFERMIAEFEKSPRLGLAGGVVIDPGQPKDRLPRNREDIPGATQFYRRRCFEELGGLLPIPEGGWDTLASVRARLIGYETRLVVHLVVDHLKPRNVAEGGLLRRKWQSGVRDYAQGCHPLFEFLKCLRRVDDSPLVVGALAWWMGYCFAALQRRKRVIPDDLIDFLRDEQKQRMGLLLAGRSRPADSRPGQPAGPPAGTGPAAAVASSRRCIVITPARDEEENIKHTIRSMVAQTCRPVLWIIINDGSTDRTAEIIDAAAREHPWIRPVHRPDRGFRQPGGGVVESFYAGYAQIPQPHAWDFLVKFDADLSFESDFFERCLDIFAREPKLGIGGGMICMVKDGRLVSESPGDPAFHVRGATKFYRRECWEAIGGLVQAPGWDTIDELKANMLGWTTHSFAEAPLKHHRYTGTADGTWRNQVKFGLANYITGYHPLFMAVKCLRRVFQYPYLVGAVAIGWGYCKGFIQSTPQVNDPGLIHYIRRQQMNKLLGRPSVW